MLIHSFLMVCLALVGSALSVFTPKAEAAQDLPPQIEEVRDPIQCLRDPIQCLRDGSQCL